MTVSLFEEEIESLAPGAVLLRGLALPLEEQILAEIDQIVEVAPFRHMITPGGFRMSVAMTSCGDFGWVTDSRGYRYEAKDPVSGKPWPEMPESLMKLATSAAKTAGYDDFNPDSCLINCYEPGAKMSLHQDKDEKNLGAPIVSVSLGLPSTFLFGGLERTDKTQKILLTHGDVVVWGGPSRLYYHGIAALKDGIHEKVGRRRLNLTFRRAV